MGRSNRGINTASAAQGAIVFTDIDETVGEHPNRATGLIYPGMSELLVALSQGPHDAEAEPIQVLSARFPNMLFSFLAIKDGCPLDEYLETAGGKLGKRHYGLLWDQWRGIISKRPFDFIENRCHYLGKRKMTNILNEFKGQKEKLCEPRDYIFCGDDGEGDVIAGTAMLEHPELGSRMKAVLIHEVDTNDRNATAKAGRKRRIMETAKARSKIVIFHEDVADAARQAQQKGLISGGGYAKVMKAINPYHFGPLAGAPRVTKPGRTTQWWFKTGLRRRPWTFSPVTKLMPIIESNNSKTLCA